MVKLHRIDSDFYTFFLPGENESDPPREYHIEAHFRWDDNSTWSVFDDRNRFVASYATLSDIRTSF